MTQPHDEQYGKPKNENKIIKAYDIQASTRFQPIIFKLGFFLNSLLSSLFSIATTFLMYRV